MAGNSSGSTLSSVTGARKTQTVRRRRRKPGYKTTEFWCMLLFQVGSVCAAISGVLEPEPAAILVAFSNAAYAVSRGITKSKEDS
jgi:hypothetical protein